MLCICVVMAQLSLGAYAAISGAGSADDPYLVSSVADLIEFASSVNEGTSYSGKVVKLTKSLDLSETLWTPIGNSSNKFEGIFDGNYHVIDGLSVNSTDGYAGFFGGCESATIKNLGIVNAKIVSSGCDVAVLVGNTIGGSIENCFVTGSVEAYSGVGGIIGSTHGTTDDTVVKNCYARVTLSYETARGDCAGISGWNYSNSIHIINSYSSCIGEVKPIAGWSDGSDVENERFENVYFDKSLSPNFSEDAGRIDLGKTSSELKTQSTFVDFDFTDVWAIDSAINGGYPYLRGFDGVSLSGAPGTLTVLLTDNSGAIVEDATVEAVSSQRLSLAYQKNGIYSTTVPNESANYLIIVNDEEIETVSHNGTEAIEKFYTLSSGDFDAVTYSYAYDASRSPAFPSAKGEKIILYNFGLPLMNGATKTNINTHKYASAEGEWTLTEVGAYGEKSTFSPAPTEYLDSIVNAVGTKYGLNDDGKAGLIIHKLTDESDALIGYGVVIGVDENGHAFFVGDLWNTQGAGYFLSQTAIEDLSGEIEFGTEQIAQSSYSVSLSPADVLFDDAEEGYSVPEAKTVTVENTGNVATGALTVALSGDTASSFTLSKSSISDIAISGNDTFTVVPKEGLAVGTYSETIKVSGEKIMPVTINVSFEVKEAEEVKKPRRKGNGELTGPLLAKKDKNDEDNSLTIAPKEIILTVGEKEAIVFGETKQSDVAPYIKNDRVMLPVRFVSENLGAEVEWNEADGVVTVIKDDITIILYIDKATALVNGEEVSLDSSACIKESRTFVPIRFIAENLGEEVKWNGEEQTVTIIVK